MNLKLRVRICQEWNESERRQLSSIWNLLGAILTVNITTAYESASGCPFSWQLQHILAELNPISSSLKPFPSRYFKTITTEPVPFVDEEKIDLVADKFDQLANKIDVVANKIEQQEHKLDRLLEVMEKIHQAQQVRHYLLLSSKWNFSKKDSALKYTVIEIVSYI